MGSSIREILKNAEQQGLRSCRPDLAPAVRTVHPQTKTEEEGECLILMSEPEKGVLPIVHNDSERHHIGDWACELNKPLPENFILIFEQVAA